MHTSLQRRVRRRIERAAPTIESPVLERLLAYFDLLSKWNERMNLTARVDTDESIDRLLVEPIVASRFLPRGEFSHLDVGSGGGSPAIPLKVMAPAMRLRMVESKVRKSAFLREAVRHLELADCIVEAVRVEDLLLRPSLRAAMDIVSIRAVKVDAEMLHRLALLLKQDGEFFLFVRGASGAQLHKDPFLTLRGRERLVDSLQSELLRVARQ